MIQDYVLIHIGTPLPNPSANIIQSDEKEAHKLLLRGTIRPETFRRWVEVLEEAKEVEDLVSRTRRKKNRNPLDSERLPNLHVLGNSPCKDGRMYDRLIHQKGVGRGSSFPVKKSIFEKVSDKRRARPANSIALIYRCGKISFGFSKRRAKSDCQLDIEKKNEADLGGLSEGKKNEAKPMSQCLDGGIAKVQDQGKKPAETISSQAESVPHHSSSFSVTKSSEAFNSEIENEEIIEILPPNSTHESESDTSGGRSSFTEIVQKQHETTQFPESKLESTLSALSGKKPKMSDPEIEWNLPLESVNIESSSSVPKESLNENNPAACSGTDEVEDEAESGPTATDYTLMVEVSVAGDLSISVDLKLEISHAFSSRTGHNAIEEDTDFALKEDNYRILMSEKTEKKIGDQSTAIEGDLTSSELPPRSRIPGIKLPESLILKLGGARLTSPPEEKKWRQAVAMILRDNAFPSLPQEPGLPNLVLLFLQGNRCLRKIPESFFSCMPSLRVLDLSDSEIRSLPPSLFMLHELQVLFLCNCKFLDKLPEKIEELVKLEVLNLSGTELNELPDGIGNLTHLRYLKLTVYGTDDESEYGHLRGKFLPHNIHSKLQELEALSIVVHPEDVRWIRNADAIIEGIGSLKRLCYLELYFPKAEILKKFIEMSGSWKRIRSNAFKFVVGQNVKRFADRVPKEVEIKFNEQNRCLRFVNGKNAPQAVIEVLKHVTAFYLDHHQVLSSLSELDITTSKKLKFCIVRECPNVEVIIMDDGSLEAVFPNLEHLGLHYLWKLESISNQQLNEGSFSSLKSLVVHTCPRLEFILHESMLQFLCNLKKLVIEDCENVKEIIRDSYGEVNDSIPALPHKLRKIKLYYLPQLGALWRKLEANLEDPKPNEDFNISVTVYSCPQLKLSVLESFSVVTQLNSETVFQNEDAAWSEQEKQFAAKKEKEKEKQRKRERQRERGREKQKQKQKEKEKEMRVKEKFKMTLKKRPSAEGEK